MKKIITRLFAVSSLLLAMNSMANTDIDHIKSIDAFKNSEVKETPIKGLYSSNQNGKIVFVDAEGKFAINGEMFERKGNAFISLRAKQEREARTEIMNEIFAHKSEYAHYPSLWTNDKGLADKRATIFVFSDITCPYCKHFHNDIANFQKSGIEIYYIPFPRKGLDDSNTVKGLQKILCSKDKVSEYNKAFLNPEGYIKNTQSSEVSCSDSYDLITFYNFADKLSVLGTPAIFTEKGSAIFGYDNGVDFARTLKQRLNDESFDGDK
jgi:thiol:disulfide interchange protein DsbC